MYAHGTSGLMTIGGVVLVFSITFSPDTTSTFPEVDALPTSLEAVQV